MLKKKAIISKTVSVGFFTFLSRILGIVREILFVRFVGASALSDAFFTAYKIPNSLRKVFAEGALSAALVPTIVHTMKHKDKHAVDGLLTIAFIFFETSVAFLCLFVMIYAQQVISFIAPGFSIEQIVDSAAMLRIVMPFIFFISTSALFAGALHSVGSFTVPALGPVVLNIILILGLSFCLWLQLSLYHFCFIILMGGFIVCLLHLCEYIKKGFVITAITKNDLVLFLPVVTKFLLCLPSISVLELSLFIDTSFASYLPHGSISLFYYANRFVGIPLGIFAIAFSTILLPHFSRVQTYAPKRLHFYLLESTKLIFWVTIPATLIMAFFAEDIFYTTFFSKKFTILQVKEAASILQAFLIGLSFFSLNKILLNIYYALHNTWIPAVIAVVAAVVNIICDYYFITYLQATGLALATTISAMVQTFLFVLILYTKFKFRIFIREFCIFLYQYTLALIIALLITFPLYKIIYYIIETYTCEWTQSLLLTTICVWSWVGLLILLFFAIVWKITKITRTRIYFLP